MVLDDQLIREHYPDKETYESVVGAFRTLSVMGVFDLIVHSTKLSLLDSLTEESEEALAKKLLLIRTETRVLLTLRDLYPPQKKE